MVFVVRALVFIVEGLWFNSLLCQMTGGASIVMSEQRKKGATDFTVRANNLDIPE